MKDFIGSELSVGDTVVAMKLQYRELVLCEIIKITEKMIILKEKETKKKEIFKQFPQQVVKID